MGGGRVAVPKAGADSASYLEGTVVRGRMEAEKVGGREPVYRRSVNRENECDLNNWGVDNALISLIDET